MSLARRGLLFAFVAAALSPGVALAGREPGDHDEAREALERRDILPLQRILEIAQRTVPGEVLEVDLDRDDGRLLYEVEILARNGRVRTVTLDARTGAVLEVEDDD